MRLKDDESVLAWGRIFRSPDGRVAYAGLASIVAEIGPPETCALHEHRGRRSLAAELMNLAAMGEASNEPTDAGRREKRNAGDGERKSRRHGPAGRG